MKSPVIVALDYADAASALALADRLDPTQCRLKVGKELFTRSGPWLVEQIHARGFEVFLDLKFHDIPNTVAGAVSAAADLGVWMVNVHAAGGRRMMEAAASAVAGSTHKPILIAVTVLTSMSEEDLAEMGYSETPGERVMHLAQMAQEAGMQGVVCSAEEASDLKAARGNNFALVTPGIRLAGDSADDQRRVVTPGQAVSDGADYLVIGRSITAAADPSEALARVLAEL